MKNDYTTEQVVYVFLVISGSIGVAFGCVGLGVGLVFLTVGQAFGVALLSTGTGAILGGCFGGKAILRAIIKVCEERQNKT